MSVLKISVAQFNCAFADVPSNLAKIRSLVIQASKEGMELILFPEFCTSAIGYSKEMLKVGVQGEMTRTTLQKLSHEFHIIIGGSYLLFDGTDCYNSFDLFFPNGEIYSHKKDIPTQFENCYYTKGDANHILHTPIGNIGVALCWEMIRYDTIKRLSEQADIILAGSCWWDLPDDAPSSREPLRKYNQKLALETPVTFAKLLHTPVVHASHCGKITAFNFPSENQMKTRQLVGASQIIDEQGNILARRNFDEGEGLIFADIDICKHLKSPSNMMNDSYWIPNLPDTYIKAWNEMNPLGECYYQQHALPYYKTHS